MIQFVLMSLLAAKGRFFNALVRDISAFNTDKYTAKTATNHRQCQSVLGNAWQCWARFGDHQVCSDIIRQAWQCSGQGPQNNLKDFLVLTVFPKVLLQPINWETTDKEEIAEIRREVIVVS